MAPYPDTPGHKTGDTSAEAARAIARPARALQLSILCLLAKSGPMSTDQCAEKLRTNVLAVRPRFSELKRQGYIEPTGSTTRNASGKRARIWGIL